MHHSCHQSFGPHAIWSKQSPAIPTLRTFFKQRDPRVVGSVRIWANPLGVVTGSGGRSGMLSPRGDFGSVNLQLCFLERNLRCELEFVCIKPLVSCRWGGSPRSVFWFGSTKKLRKSRLWNRFFYFWHFSSRWLRVQRHIYINIRSFGGS